MIKQQKGLFTMEDIYEKIANVSDYDISDVLDAVLARYMELFPGWEIGTYSIEKKGSRREQLDRMITVLEKLKTFP